MAELQLGGKVIATQSGANNPVMASNVVMDNVNVNNALASATFPAGHILQVKSTTVTARSSSTESLASGIGGDVGLNVTITPKSNNSSFFIMVNVGLGTCTNGQSWCIILSRDGNRIGNGESTGNHYGVLFRSIDHTGGTGTDTNHGIGGSGSYLDLTSGTIGTPIVFKGGLAGEGGATSYINRVESDYNGSGAVVASAYTQSTFTVMEIQK